MKLLVNNGYTVDTYATLLFIYRRECFSSSEGHRKISRRWEFSGLKECLTCNLLLDPPRGSINFLCKHCEDNLGINPIMSSKINRLLDEVWKWIKKIGNKRYKKPEGEPRVVQGQIREIKVKVPDYIIELINEIILKVGEINIKNYNKLLKKYKNRRI